MDSEKILLIIGSIILTKKRMKYLLAFRFFFCSFFREKICIISMECWSNDFFTFLSAFSFWSKLNRSIFSPTHIDNQFCFCVSLIFLIQNQWNVLSFFDYSANQWWKLSIETSSMKSSIKSKIWSILFLWFI